MRSTGISAFEAKRRSPCAIHSNQKDWSILRSFNILRNYCALDARFAHTTCDKEDLKKMTVTVKWILRKSLQLFWSEFYFATILFIFHGRCSGEETNHVSNYILSTCRSMIFKFLLSREINYRQSASNSWIFCICHCNSKQLSASIIHRQFRIFRNVQLRPKVPLIQILGVLLLKA